MLGCGGWSLCLVGNEEPEALLEEEHVITYIDESWDPHRCVQGIGAQMVLSSVTQEQDVINPGRAGAAEDASETPGRIPRSRGCKRAGESRRQSQEVRSSLNCDCWTGTAVFDLWPTPYRHIPQDHRLPIKQEVFFGNRNREKGQNQYFEKNQKALWACTCGFKIGTFKKGMLAVVEGQGKQASPFLAELSAGVYS